MTLVISYSIRIPATPLTPLFPLVLERLEEMSPVLDRFLICCDAVSVPPRHQLTKDEHVPTTVHDKWWEVSEPFYDIQSKRRLILPETRY